MKLEPEASSWGSFNQHFGLAAGVNLGEYWGFELAGDGGEYTMVAEGIGGISEYSVTSLMPQVRFRRPLAGGRVVPYLMGGFGVTYGEDNDVKAASEPHQLEAKGVYPAFSIGGGAEYFIARNISLSLESRYLYTWNHKYTLDGVEGRGDLSHVQLLLGMRLYFIEF
jgi:opacity protein-like surface antigen